jgi:excisionase family DNA binding protein
MEKQTVSIKEAAQQLGLGADALYRAVRNGEIPVIRIGGRILVPKAVLLRLLADPVPQGLAAEVAVGLHEEEVARG